MISFVATMFRSELYIPEFVERCTSAAEALSAEHEIVLVNDGSPDGSLDVAVDLLRSYSSLRVIELSRNFGHHAAMLSGLEHSKGEFVFLLDSDLEEDPAWLLHFHEEMMSTGCDVVYGVQRKRRERGLTRIASTLFYRIRRSLLDSQIPQDVTTARLMRRAYVDALLQHPETTTPILDLWTRTGFLQQPVPVTKPRTSPSTYSLGVRMSLFLDMFVIGSGRLLVLSSLLGLATVAISALAALALLIRWSAFSRPSPGWTSVMLTVLFFGGAILFTVSLIGLNLARVAEEVRRRPRTIVRKIHGAKAGSGD